MIKEMGCYILKKGFVGLMSLGILSVLIFYMARLAPGDPLVSYYGERVEKMSTEEKNRSLERLGLNEPIYVQYTKWLGAALQGDFGKSFKYKQGVLEVIQSRSLNTFILGGISFALIFIGALLLGGLCAFQEGRWLDKLIGHLGIFISCMPEFWLALIFILIFSVTYKLLPSSGAYSIGMEKHLGNRLTHLILPLAVVVMSHLWYYAYMVRNKLLEEVRMDYVLLARAKGLNKRQVMLKHCLRNIMPSYVSIMAIALPHILGGTYIVETVFSYPGLGTLCYESAQYHDYNLLMVLCLITGCLTIVCNRIGEMINEKIDPRIAKERVNR